MILVSIAALTTDLAEAFGFSNLGFLSNYSFVFFDNHFISIICLIWFGLPKLLKCFSKTNALGLAIESQFAKLNGDMMRSKQRQVISTLMNIKNF